MAKKKTITLPAYYDPPGDAPVEEPILANAQERAALQKLFLKGRKPRRVGKHKVKSYGLLSQEGGGSRAATGGGSTTNPGGSPGAVGNARTSSGAQPSSGARAGAVGTKTGGSGSGSQTQSRDAGSRTSGGVGDGGRQGSSDSRRSESSTRPSLGDDRPSSRDSTRRSGAGSETATRPEAQSRPGQTRPGAGSETATRPGARPASRPASQPARPVTPTPTTANVGRRPAKMSKSEAAIRAEIDNSAKKGYSGPKGVSRLRELESAARRAAFDAMVAAQQARNYYEEGFENPLGDEEDFGKPDFERNKFGLPAGSAVRRPTGAYRAPFDPDEKIDKTESYQDWERQYTPISATRAIGPLGIFDTEPDTALPGSNFGPRVGPQMTGQYPAHMLDEQAQEYSSIPNMNFPSALPKDQSRLAHSAPKRDLGRAIVDENIDTRYSDQARDLRDLAGRIAASGRTKQPAETKTVAVQPGRPFTPTPGTAYIGSDARPKPSPYKRGDPTVEVSQFGPRAQPEVDSSQFGPRNPNMNVRRTPLADLPTIDYDEPASPLPHPQRPAPQTQPVARTEDMGFGRPDTFSVAGNIRTLQPPQNFAQGPRGIFDAEDDNVIGSPLTPGSAHAKNRPTSIYNYGGVQPGLSAPQFPGSMQRKGYPPAVSPPQPGLSAPSYAKAVGGGIGDFDADPFAEKAAAVIANPPGPGPINLDQTSHPVTNGVPDEYYRPDIRGDPRLASMLTPRTSIVGDRANSGGRESNIPIPRISDGAGRIPAGGGGSGGGGSGGGGGGGGSGGGGGGAGGGNNSRVFLQEQINALLMRGDLAGLAALMAHGSGSNL